MAKKAKWPPMHEAIEEQDVFIPVTAGNDLVDALSRIEGMNRELAEHVAEHGVPDDVYVVQTFYRVSAVTAAAIIKVMKENKE